MSRSYGDQRGKQTNGEILGRGCFTVGPNGKVYPEVGGEEVGSPISKRDAKREAARLRRYTKIEIED